MNPFERDFFTDPELLRDPTPYCAALRALGPVVREAHHGAFMVSGIGEIPLSGQLFTLDPPRHTRFDRRRFPMSSIHPHERIARQLIEGVTRGDVDSVDRLYADDIRVWRNVDQRELVKKQALKVVAILSQLKDIEYRDLRIVPTEHGYVQQHVLSCTGPKGETVLMPSCIVARVEDDRIARIDEYADSAAMAPLMS